MLDAAAAVAPANVNVNVNVNVNCGWVGRLGAFRGAGKER